MSKDLIVRLREAAAQRVASTAMIGADDLSAAADALESLDAAYGGALESLDAAYGGAVEAGRALAKQAFKAEQERDALVLRVSELTYQIDRAEEAMVERDALAAELKAAREQEPIGYINPKTSHWLAAHKASSASYGAIRIHCSETDSQTVPLYAHPVPARELTDAVDDPAQHIRQIDGNHSMGAEVLAESITEAGRYTVVLSGGEEE